MKELFVPFSIALLAKGKGFDEPCLRMSEHKKACSNKVDGDCPLPNVHCNYPDCEIDKSIQSIGLPLYDQLTDWFYDKHQIEINVLSVQVSAGASTGYRRRYILGKLGTDVSVADESPLGFLNKQEALNKAFEEAFKLI